MNTNWSRSFHHRLAVCVKKQFPNVFLMGFSLLKFDNRMGDGTRVYLGSTEMTALCGLKKSLSTTRKYFDFLEKKGVLLQGNMSTVVLE